VEPCFLKLLVRTTVLQQLWQAAAVLDVDLVVAISDQTLANLTIVRLRTLVSERWVQTSLESGSNG
jgi:hypothetical protein